MCQQIARISRYRCKRGPQIVRNGTKQIRPELFVPHGYGCLPFLFRVPEPFQRHGTLAYDRGKNAVFKRFQALAVQVNRDHTITVSVQADGMIQRFRLFIHFRVSARCCLMDESPFCDLRLIFILFVFS